jgi:hypothetical protein
VDWTTVAATAVGGGIAIVTSLVSERYKAVLTKRERAEERKMTRADRSETRRRDALISCRSLALQAHKAATEVQVLRVRISAFGTADKAAVDETGALIIRINALRNEMSADAAASRAPGLRDVTMGYYAALTAVLSDENDAIAPLNSALVAYVAAIDAALNALDEPEGQSP